MSTKKYDNQKKLRPRISRLLLQHPMGGNLEAVHFAHTGLTGRKVLNQLLLNLA